MFNETKAWLKNHEKTRYTIFVILYFDVLFIVTLLIIYLWPFLSSIDKGILTALISAFAFLVGSYAVKNKDLKYLILKDSREKKSHVYSMVIKSILDDIVVSDELFRLDDKVLLDEGIKNIKKGFIDFTSELYMWGSDEVVEEWNKYTKNRTKSDDDLLTQRGKIILLIRAELGYKSKKIFKNDSWFFPYDFDDNLPKKKKYF